MSRMGEGIVMVVRVFFLCALAGCAVTGGVRESVPEVPGMPGVVYLPTARPGATFESVKAEILDLAFLGARDVWPRRPQDDRDLKPGTSVRFDAITVDREAMTFVAGRTPPFSLAYDDLVEREIAVRKAESSYALPFVVTVAGVGVRFFARDLDSARRFADDLLFLQQTMGRGNTGFDRVTPEFESSAAGYRALAVKPQVTEEQRRFIVQANALGQKKDYAGALEIYGKALKVDPVAYPEAYFNMALLSAEKGRYRAAIGFMRKYLLLVPDAKDARAAQDKIYEWEALMGGR